MYNVKKLGTVGSQNYSGLVPTVPHLNVNSYVTDDESLAIVGAQGYFSDAISNGDVNVFSLILVTASDVSALCQIQEDGSLLKYVPVSI